MGSHTAKFLNEMGAKIVAVSDVSGGILNEQGIDLEKLLLHLQKEGKLAGFSNGGPITNEELLGLNCDVLIPAALDGAIHKGNVDKVGASLIVEAANSPLTYEAYH